MPKLKVLYVAHAHPSVSTGGAEIHAMDLYRAMRERADVEPLLLARREGDHIPPRWPPISMADPSDPNQSFLTTKGSQFDGFLGRSHEPIARYFHHFLVAHQPDVVHFQHTHGLGYDLIREARQTLPQAPIVYTLHEFLPICTRDGQMLRIRNDEPCNGASPERCSECFPQRTAEAFFMRTKFIQSHLNLVDRFLAPSGFLRQRFVDWGIPSDRIEVHENGRHEKPSAPERKSNRARIRIGYFGQINYYKGVLLLLEALARLTRLPDAPAFEAFIHGANLQLQSREFQDEFAQKLAAAGPSTRYLGPYKRDQLPELMRSVDWVVMPSIWWENSPLVIQEAFLHRRPVICSNIGGMAEKVTDGVNGLHFRARDSAHLSEVLLRAIKTPGLWSKLEDGIPDVFTIQESARYLSGLYRELREERVGNAARPLPDNVARLRRPRMRTSGT